MALPCSRPQAHLYFLTAQTQLAGSLLKEGDGTSWKHRALALLFLVPTSPGSPGMYICFPNTISNLSKHLHLCPQGTRFLGPINDPLRRSGVTSLKAREVRDKETYLESLSL